MAAAGIIFTYNATDAINMALLGRRRPGDRVVTTAIEHNAVVRLLSYLATQGVTVKVVNCDPAGRIWQA